MSKINKILSKALSTQSEDEAVTALLHARKLYSNEEVKLEEDKNAWKDKAQELHILARKYKDSSLYWSDAYVRMAATKDRAIARVSSLKKQRDAAVRLNVILAVSIVAVIVVSMAVITSIIGA